MGLLESRRRFAGRPVTGAAAALLALLVWALVVFGTHGGNPTPLAPIGDQRPLSPRLQGQELVVLKGQRGRLLPLWLALAGLVSEGYWAGYLLLAP